MRNIIVSAAVGCVLLTSQSVVAQQTLVVGAPAMPMLHVGTEIPVRTRIELSTEHKALRAGQRFEIETSEPIQLNGRTVIPVGTTGVGEVTDVSNKGMWGKSGHFGVQLLYLRMGDRQIRLTGKADDKGHAGGAAAVAVSAIIFLPAGFFMTGTSARLPAGTAIKGFLAEDVPVAFAGDTGPAPLMVGAPAGSAPAMTVGSPAARSPAAAPPPAAAGSLIPLADGSTKLVTVAAHK